MRDAQRGKDPWLGRVQVDGLNAVGARRDLALHVEAQRLFRKVYRHLTARVRRGSERGSIWEEGGGGVGRPRG